MPFAEMAANAAARSASLDRPISKSPPNQHLKIGRGPATAPRTPTRKFAPAVQQVAEAHSAVSFHRQEY